MADMFTKPLGTTTFEYQRENLGIDSAEDVLLVKIKGGMLKNVSSLVACIIN